MHQHNPVSPVVTVSIGLKIQEYPEEQSIDVELIYRMADDALYQAKENGRNQVVEHDGCDAIGKPAAANS